MASLTLEICSSAVLLQCVRLTLLPALPCAQAGKVLARPGCPHCHRLQGAGFSAVTGGERHLLNLSQCTLLLATPAASCSLSSGEEKRGLSWVLGKDCLPAGKDMFTQ